MVLILSYSKASLTRDNAFILFSLKIYVIRALEDVADPDAEQD